MGVVHLCYGLGKGTRGRYHIFSNFFSVFVLLLIVPSWLVYASSLGLFNCSVFSFFVSSSFN